MTFASSIARATCLLFALACCLAVAAQDLTRIQAEFSIKEKGTDGTASLTLGTVYYDKVLKKAVYRVRFPEPEVIVIQGANMYRVAEGKPTEHALAGELAEHSVFHLALSGHLPHFGLKGSAYTMSDMERDEDMVITTWEPPATKGAERGSVVLSQVDKRLHGLVSYKPGNKELAGKQLFRKYTAVGSVQFPTEVLQILYFDQGERTKLTTYKNIELNGTDDSWYDYAVPD